MANTRKMSTERLVLGAILTALVIVLQVIGGFVKVGPCNLALALIPIIIGGAVCSPKIGAWLGFVCGMTILLSGQAALFIGFNFVGAVITTLVKGTLCGYFSGLVYKLLENKNRTVAAVSSAIVCPVVNTGVFFIGCFVFFVKDLAQMAVEMGFGDNLIYFMFVGLAGVNFLFEFFTSVIFSSVIVRLIAIRKK